MKTERTHFGSIHILALFALLTWVAVAGEQTNKVRSIVMSPEDWDPRKHVLASFLATNTPGIYTLPTIWSGTEKVTARTGWYGTKSGMAEQTNEWFVATKLRVLEDSKLSGRMGKHHLWLDDDGTPAASYRPSLPSDADLLAITNSTSVSNLLGWNPFLNSSNSESLGVRFFTLRPYDSIELLQVTFMVRAGKPDMVDSLCVRRGKLHPQQRKQ